MRKVMISGSGQDRPGIVAAVTRVLFEEKCNVEDTSMTRLEDHFALLMIVNLPSRLTVEQLEARLKDATEPLGLDLHLHTIETDETLRAARGKVWMISVTGMDQTGIIAHVSAFLAAKGINVQTLTSKRLYREHGDPLFLMSLEVEVPDTLPPDAVHAGLRAVAQEEGLEIHGEPLEEFTL